MRILMHQCCGPCSIFPIKSLKEAGAEVTAYFYNHNIHPVTEYYKRLETAIEVNRAMDTTHIIDEEYGLVNFLREHVNAEQDRCSGCYNIRLNKTALKAAELGFDYFTSTLLYSKMQKHEVIKEIAVEAAKKHGVKFYYHDFREGWDEGIKISKEMEIYRQNYCGCIYSEQDRFLNQLSRKFNKRYF